MLTALELEPTETFVQELLTEFFTTDPRSWRLRQVTQITPLDPQSYLARISHQFRLPRELIHPAWDRALAQAPRLPRKPPQDEIEIILPIDYLPKYVLLNFSLEDPSAKPLPLLTSADSIRVSLGLVRAIMGIIDARAPNKGNTAATFFADFEPIILALISTGQREIPRLLELPPTFPREDPSPFEFYSGMLAFYEDVLKPFTGEPRLPSPFAQELCGHFAEDHQTIALMTRQGKEFLAGPDGFRSPLLNPGLLVGNYLRNQPPTEGDNIQVRVTEFLLQCRRFIKAVLGLQADDYRFNWGMRILRTLSRFYIAYTRLTVPIVAEGRP